MVEILTLLSREYKKFTRTYQWKTIILKNINLILTYPLFVYADKMPTISFPLQALYNIFVIIQYIT